MSSLAKAGRPGKRRRRVRVEPADQRVIDATERALRICRERRLDEEVEHMARREQLKPRQAAILRDEFQRKEYDLYRQLELLPVWFPPSEHVKSFAKATRMRARLRRVQRDFEAPIRELVEITGHGERTVKRHVKRLEAIGVIRRRRTMQHRERSVKRRDGTVLRGERREFAENRYRIVGMRRRDRLYALADEYAVFVTHRRRWGGARVSDIKAERVRLSNIEAARIVAEDRQRTHDKVWRARIAKERRESGDDIVALEQDGPSKNYIQDVDSFSLSLNQRKKKKNGPPGAASLPFFQKSKRAPEPPSTSMERRAPLAFDSKPGSTKGRTLGGAILLESHTEHRLDQAARARDLLAAQAALTRQQDELDRAAETRTLRQLDDRADTLRAVLDRTPDDLALQAQLEELDALRAMLWAQFELVWGQAA